MNAKPPYYRGLFTERSVHKISSREWSGGEADKIIMKDKLTMALAIGALITTAVSANIPTVSALETYVDGHSAGKAQGHRDAVSGYAANDRCGTGHSNDYCGGYKIGYNIEYYWSKLVQDPKN